MLLFEGIGRPLLILHGILAMALLGASTHQSILCVAYLLGRFRRAPLEAVYLRILTWLYPLTFALGAVIYPAYRVKVRRDVLDLSAPMASNLFDIKENLAALGVLILLSMVLTRRRLDPGAPGAQGGLTRLYAAGGISLGIFSWAMVVLGLYVTAEEGL